MFESFFRSICYPYPNVYKSELERELTYQRSKCLLFIQLIFTSSVLIYRPFVLEKALPSLNMWIAFGLTALCLHIATARRYHKYFEYFYNITTMFLASYSVTLHEEAVVGSWMIFFLCPVYMFFLTGSIRHFLFQAIGQIFSAIYVYRGPTLEMISRYSAQDFIRRLTGAFIVGQFLMIATMIHLDSSRKIAYQEAALSEKRKDEADRQRTFLFSFSHELRNLMNSVIGSVDICLLEPLPDKAKDILLSAKLYGRILMQEISNILDTGRVDINELEIHKSMLSSRGLLNKIWLVAGDLIKRKGLKGKLAISKNLPKKLILDEGRFTQILLNLLGNAIKFTEAGNIDIIIEWLDQESVNDDSYAPFPFNEDGIFDKKVALLHLNSEYNCLSIGAKLSKRKTRSQNNFKGILRLVVKDSGCGMTQDEVQKLFQKFSQVGDKSKKVLGTGLGLFISKYVSNKMGGDIRVFSEKNRGTAFILTLPTDCSNSSLVLDRLQEMSPYHISSGSGFSSLHDIPLTFLIVDETPMHIEIISSYVTQLHGTVRETADSGPSAVEKYKKLCMEKSAPNVITIDVYIPGMSSKEAIRQIRGFEKETKLKHAIVIIISGEYSNSLRDSYMKDCDLMIGGFLKKPVIFEEFRDTVIQLYEKYHQSINF